MDGLKRYVNDDRFRVDGGKNMRLLAFAFTIVFVWTGPYTTYATMTLTFTLTIYLLIILLVLYLHHLYMHYFTIRC